MSVWLQLGGVLLASLFLMKATEFTLKSFQVLVAKMRVRKMVVAAMLVALSTSLPELFVGVLSALEGQPEISLGNVLGSNIANLSLVIGGAALVSGSVPVIGEYMRKELVAAFLAGCLPILLVMDGVLTRLDGVLLLLAYGLYVSEVVIAGKHKSLAEKGGGKHYGILKKLKKLHKNHTDVWLLRLFLGVLALVLSADFLVKMASSLAEGLGLPSFLVGVLVVAVGTSLPELVLEIGAIKKREIALVFGDLLGSVVANATLIIGVTTLISPVKVGGVSRYDLASFMFVLIFGFFWMFTNSKKRLDRWEGLVLLGFYFMFIGLEFWLNSLRGGF